MHVKLKLQLLGKNDTKEKYYSLWKSYDFSRVVCCRCARGPWRHSTTNIRKKWNNLTINTHKNPVLGFFKQIRIFSFDYPLINSEELNPINIVWHLSLIPHQLWHGVSVVLVGVFLHIHKGNLYSVSFYDELGILRDYSPLSTNQRTCYKDIHRYKKVIMIKTGYPLIISHDSIKFSYPWTLTPTY